MNQDFVKLDRFDGTNFTRWQDKMKFLLIALKIFYVLDPSLNSLLVQLLKILMLPKWRGRNVRMTNLSAEGTF